MSTEYVDEREKQVHQDFTAIMDKLMPVGQSVLQRLGSVRPFAGVINNIGTFELVNADPSDQATSKDVLRFLTDALQVGMQDGRFRAIGVCLDVQTTSQDNSTMIDALQVMLTHAVGETVHFFLPYVKRDGAVEWGMLFFRK